MLNLGVKIIIITLILLLGLDAWKNYKRKKHARARVIAQSQHDTDALINVPGTV